MKYAIRSPFRVVVVPRLGECGFFELRVELVGLVHLAGFLESAGQVREVFRVRRALGPRAQEGSGRGVVTRCRFDRGEFEQCVVVVGEGRQSLCRVGARRFNAAPRALEVRDVRQRPRSVFGLGGIHRVVGLQHQLRRPLDVAEELTQVGRARNAGDVAGTELEHPAHGFLGCFVVTELDARVRDEPVHDHVVGNLAIQLLGEHARDRELVQSQLGPDLELASLVVAGSELERLGERFLGIDVVVGVGGLASASREGECELVVVASLPRFALDGVERPLDLFLCRRGRSRGRGAVGLVVGGKGEEGDGEELHDGGFVFGVVGIEARGKRARAMCTRTGRDCRPY